MRFYLIVRCCTDVKYFLPVEVEKIHCKALKIVYSSNECYEELLIRNNEVSIHSWRSPWFIKKITYIGYWDLQKLNRCYWLLCRCLIRWWCGVCWQKIGRALWLVAITLYFEKQTPTCENYRNRRWLFKHAEKKFYWASGAYIKRGKLFILH